MGGDAIGAVVGQITKGLDELFTSPEERGAQRVKYMSKVLDTLVAQMQAQTQVIIAEAQGQSVLARNWRPGLMSIFGVIIAWNYVIRDIIGMFGVEMVTLQIPPQMWTLLTLGVTGYIAGRSIEKTVGAVGGLNLTSGDKIEKKASAKLLKMAERAQKDGKDDLARELIEAAKS